MVMQFRYVTDNEIIDLSTCYDQLDITYTSDLLCIHCVDSVKVYDIKSHKLLSTIDGSYRLICGYHDNIFFLDDQHLYRLSKNLKDLHVIHDHDLGRFFNYDRAMTEYHMIILCNNLEDNQEMTFEIFKDGSVVTRKYKDSQMLIGINECRNLVSYEYDEAWIKPRSRDRWAFERYFVMFGLQKIFLDVSGDIINLVDSEDESIISTIECPDKISYIYRCSIWPSRFTVSFYSHASLCYGMDDGSNSSISKHYLIIPDIYVKPSRKSLLDIDGFHDIIVVSSS